MKYLLLGLLLVASCKEPEPRRYTKSVQDEYEVTEVNPPKHFYVTLKNLRTGEVYKHEYVSKHCNTWRETAYVGKRVLLYRVSWMEEGKEYTDFYRLREEICK
jgi:hypothetical protein